MSRGFQWTFGAFGSKRDTPTNLKNCLERSLTSQDFCYVSFTLWVICSTSYMCPDSSWDCCLRESNAISHRVNNLEQMVDWGQLIHALRTGDHREHRTSDSVEGNTSSGAYILTWEKSLCSLCLSFLVCNTVTIFFARSASSGCGGQGACVRKVWVVKLLQA